MITIVVVVVQLGRASAAVGAVPGRGVRLPRLERAGLAHGLEVRRTM